MLADLIQDPKVRQVSAPIWAIVERDVDQHPFLVAAAFRAKILSRDDSWLKAQANRAGFSSLEAWIAALGVAARGEGR